MFKKRNWTKGGWGIINKFFFPNEEILIKNIVQI